MGQTVPAGTPSQDLSPSAFRFQSLVLTEPQSLAKGRSTTFTVSLVLHSVLVVLIAVVPILMDDFLPVPGQTLKAFFVAPPEVAPPPPPPPPPAAGARPAAKAPTAPRQVEDNKFVAPIEVPQEIAPDEGIDLGVEGGVPGGVEGGVPGGVVGGVVGGLPTGPPVTQPPVRVGGQVKEPKKIRNVAPVYPEIAKQARVQGIVILECIISPQGQVTEVKVLRGIPLLDQAAIDAVKQWIYTPTLLNGVPVPVIMTVTVNFKLS